jgi:uncharacterized protein YjbI with pentapeptide repeats
MGIPAFLVIQVDGYFSYPMCGRVDIMNSTGRIALIISTLALSACDANPDGWADGATFRNQELNGPVLNGPVLNGPVLNGPVLQGVVLNGPVLNGPVLNGPVLNGPLQQGPVLNGVVLNGPVLNGPVLNGPVLNGPVLNGPVLNGSVFSGYVVVDGESVPVSGDDFIGSTWDLRVEQRDEQGNGLVENFVLRVDDIRPSDEFDDVFLYDVKYRATTSSTWSSLCPDHDGVEGAAIPLNNYWDLTNGDRIDEPNVFTWACTNAVLAKCVLWGYRPWATGSKCKNADKGKTKVCEPVSLEDYHQTCTRMARADYCGDGEAWTVEGNAIDVRDLLNPPVQQPTTDWKIEAEWNPDGAYCVDDLRQQDLKAEGLWPQCFTKSNGKHITKNNCGSLKNERALMYSTFNSEAQQAQAF